MVDSRETAETRRGLTRRPVRSNGNSWNSISSDTLLHSGYETITQIDFYQILVNFVNMTLVPFLFITGIPNLVTVLWYTVIHCDGSYSKMLSVFSSRSIHSGLVEIWSHVHNPSSVIITILSVYGVYGLSMMKLLPGKTVYGPLTPKGNTPVYKDNGFTYFVLTLTLFCLLTCVLHIFGISPSIIYDKFDEVLLELNLFSLIFCVFLYLKGTFFPSSTDSGSSGNIIFDYYWGMELYPRVFDFDIKVFTNCRFGMMAWALLVCVHVIKSYELHGFVDSIFVSAFLQLVYIAKFFWWESGYLRTIDIMLDRAGFYICWGCLVYIPGLYASVSFYLVSHPVHLGPVISVIILLLGTLSIYINFDADRQKQAVRASDGTCLIWGRRPDIINALYQLEDGSIEESILLASGWWGISRHFHYIPELTLAFFWSLPALFDNLMPYTYLIFLTILLLHRSFRDENKCSKKYGPFWRDYCEKVPYRIIPYVF